LLISTEKNFITEAKAAMELNGKYGCDWNYYDLSNYHRHGCILRDKFAIDREQPYSSRQVGSLGNDLTISCGCRGEQTNENN